MDDAEKDLRCERAQVDVDGVKTCITEFGAVDCWECPYNKFNTTEKEE